MELEYIKGILLVKLNYLNNNTYQKMHYIYEVLNKHDISNVIINLNNIKCNSIFKEILLNLNEFMKERGKYLYLKNINIYDISLFNSYIKIISSDN